jgi:hypothetical protein
MLHSRKNQVCLQLVAFTSIACRRRVARIVQIVRLEKHNGRPGHRVAMHAELLVGEHLQASAHVVLHEHTAVAASLIPVARESVAILERSVRVVAMVHHETVTHTVKTVEQTELFTGASESIARRKQH